MGIVLRQSAANTIITYFGFGIGAINTLFLYTSFLGEEYFGIVSVVLPAANILMPLLAFGVHSTMIRFYSHCRSEEERESFLSFMMIMPLLLIIPVLGGLYLFQEQITEPMLQKNPVLAPFLWLIPVIGILMAYFEIFYAWVKIHMKSVFGNFISEVVVRMTITVLLLAVYFGWMEKDTFIYSLLGAYGLQFLAMIIYAFYVKAPVFSFSIPHNAKEIFQYSFFILFSGSIAFLLLEVDKVLIPRYLKVNYAGVYAIAGFIATVIVVPSRAMLQIIYPITVKLMSENKMDELNDLYKKSAINLQVVGGLIMLCIFLNIGQMYKIIPGDHESGMLTVFLVGLAKFYDVILGNNNAILLNTKYYRWVLFMGLLLVIMIIGLNMVLIPIYGINGSAIATLLSIIVYNTIKLLFVVKKMNLFPFTINTVKSFGIIVIIFVTFYFWNFNFHPIINIILKSGLIAITYIGINYKLKISTEINDLIDQTVSRYIRKA